MHSRSGSDPADAPGTIVRSYRDRREAGAALAARLGWYAGRTDVTVLGLARGGVPVAAEIAGRLGTTLDVLVVRKLGAPWAPEVAFGAIGPDDVLIRTELADHLSSADFSAVLASERAELARQDHSYRGGRSTDLTDRIAILVDDGLATGATARAAVAVARRRAASQVVLGVPVGARDAVRALSTVADEVVCPLVPRRFDAVGQFYRDFRPVPDAEVRGLLS